MEILWNMQPKISKTIFFNFFFEHSFYGPKEAFWAIKKMILDPPPYSLKEMFIKYTYFLSGFWVWFASSTPLQWLGVSSGLLDRTLCDTFQDISGSSSLKKTNKGLIVYDTQNKTNQSRCWAPQHGATNIWYIPIDNWQTLAAHQ